MSSPTPKKPKQNPADSVPQIQSRRRRQKQPPADLPAHAQSNVISQSSSETGTQPVLETFEQLFRWKPQKIHPSSRHSPSRSTRPPKYFDMHLDKSLRLKQVVIVKDLPAILALECDKHMATMRTSMESVLAEKIPAMPRRDIFPDIRTEAQLARWYTEARISVLTAAASGLLFQKYWSSPFSVTISSEDTRVNQDKAEADAFLQLDIQKCADLSTPDNFRDKSDLIQKYCFNQLVVWEYKSLVAGPKIMKKFSEMDSGTFPWIACEERRPLAPTNPSSHCGHEAAKHRRKDGSLKVTGRRTGPDAQNQSILTSALNSESANACGPNLSASGEKRKIEVFSGDQLTWMTPAEFIQAHCHSMSPIAENATSGDGAQLDHIFVLQQAWTEAVLNDTTFVIISSGNQEVIGIRHRETQTLFMSQSMSICEMKESYAKIFISLVIAALEDAADRAAQLEAISLNPSLEAPFRYTSLSFDSKVIDDPVIPSKGKENIDVPGDKNLLKSPSKLVAKAFEQSRLATLRIHRKKDRLGIQAPHDQNGNTWYFSRVYFNAALNTVEPIASTKAVMRAATKAHPSDLDFFLDVEVQGSLLNTRFRPVYLGQIKSDGSVTYYDECLLIKAASQGRQREDLESEFINYCRTSNLNQRGLPLANIFGLFTCRTVEKGDVCSILLMSNGGRSLAEDVTRGKALTASATRDACLTALTALHAAGFAHRNIDNEHILMQGKTVTFISVSKGVFDASDNDKEEDKTELLNSLTPVRESLSPSLTMAAYE